MSKAVLTTVYKCELLNREKKGFVSEVDMQNSNFYAWSKAMFCAVKGEDIIFCLQIGSGDMFVKRRRFSVFVWLQA